MLQLEKDLLEIQLQVSKWKPVIDKIMNPMYGYKQVGSILCDKDTYLDTNIIPNYVTIIDITCLIVNEDDNDICSSDNFGVCIKDGYINYMFGSELTPTEIRVSANNEIHIKLSKDGLFINESEVVGKFSNKFTSTKTLLLGASYDGDIIKNINDIDILSFVVYTEDNFETPVENDGNKIMSVLNQVDLIEKEYTEMGGTESDIKDVLDDVMGRKDKKVILRDKSLDSISVVNLDRTEYGLWDIANRRLLKATEGEFKASKSKHIPQYMKKLNWVGSTTPLESLKYITLDYRPNDKTILELDYWLDTSKSTNYIFYSNDNINQFSMYSSSKNNYADTSEYTVYGDTNVVNKLLDTKLSGRVKIKFSNGELKVTQNNIEQTYNFTEQSPFQVEQYLTLFNNSSTSGSMPNYKIYSCKIYEGLELKMDLVPVFDTTSGRPGLYNYITGDTYYSSSDINLDYDTLSILDDDYTQLSYIQGTGTQYIQTNYIPNHDTEYNITISNVSSANNYAAIFSADVSWGVNNVIFNLQNVNGTAKSYFYHSSSYNLPSEVQTNIQHNYRIYRGSIWVDGSSIRTNNTINESATFGKVSLFKGNVNSSICNFRLYKFSLTDKSTKKLLHNYIPVKRNSDGAIGLYDIVDNTFLNNNGTGNFTSGDIVDDDIVRLDYLDNIGFNTNMMIAGNGVVINNMRVNTLPAYSSWANIIYTTGREYVLEYTATSSSLSNAWGWFWGGSQLTTISSSHTVSDYAIKLDAGRDYEIKSVGSNLYINNEVTFQPNASTSSYNGTSPMKYNNYSTPYKFRFYDLQFLKSNYIVLHRYIPVYSNKYKKNMLYDEITDTLISVLGG